METKEVETSTVKEWRKDKNDDERMVEDAEKCEDEDIGRMDEDEGKNEGEEERHCEDG